MQKVKDHSPSTSNKNIENSIDQELWLSDAVLIMLAKEI
jgi:hypothetical protein